MKVRTVVRLWVVLSSVLLGMAAHGSYVVEADGADLIGGAIAADAEFDFVTHDFGIESPDAIQIAVANLRRAPNLHGNLLLWSAAAARTTPEHHPTLEGVEIGVPAAADVDFIFDGGEDFSYYDAAVSAAGVTPDAVSAHQALPASVQDLPVINTNTVFWILKPVEFSSFSQMSAARFGF